MNDLFLTKDIIDAYLKDLINRLYGSPNPMAPEIWCSIGTSGREVCYEMIRFLRDDLRSEIDLVDIRLDRGINGGISFHNSDSGDQISNAELKNMFFDKTLLLIDGLVYSGGTLMMAYRAVQLHKPKAILSYSTITRFSSEFIPNFFSVLVGKHDRAWLHFGGDQEFPNKRLDNLGCVRLLASSEDTSRPLPIASTGESQFKTWQDILSFCQGTRYKCFVYEEDNTIQGYTVFEINKEKSALLIKTLVVGQDYIGKRISGILCDGWKPMQAPIG